MATSKLNLAIKVNDKEVKQSFNEINSQYYKLRKSVNKLDEGTEEWVEANKKLAKVEAERKGMIERQKAYREELSKTANATDDNTAALQEFGESASDAFSSLMEGDLIGFQEGMQGVQAGIRGATKAAWGFIATPVGAAIAALAAIALATREWVQYNEAALEANRITQQLTGLTGDALDEARIRAKSMEETFGLDFKENLNAASTLVQAFAISYEEAFDRIEEGLIRGGKHNAAFMDSIKEYPKLFAQAGYTVEDFQRILNTGIDMKIYDDKLPDAIKEFSLSVMEETTASREALEYAFGKEFTDNLFQNIQNGSVTIKDALQLIAAESDKLGLNAKENAKELQQITADLFRGAGEDAGGALVIFEAVNKALSEQQRPLTALEQHLKETSAATRELNKAQDDALKSGSYALMSHNISLFWTKTKTLFFNGVAFISDIFVGFIHTQVRAFTQIFAVVKAFPGIVTNAFVDVSKEILEVMLSFQKLGDVIQKVMTLDFDGAKAAAINFKDSFLKESMDIGSAALDVVDKIQQITEAAGARVDMEWAASKTAASARAMAEHEAKEEGTKPPSLPTLDESPDPDTTTATEEETKAAEEEELQRMRDFEAKKRALQNELELSRAETEAEKEEIKKQQQLEEEQLAYEKKLEDFQKEMEFLKMTEEEKATVIEALEEAHQNTILEIQKKATEEKIRDEQRLIAARKRLMNDSLDAAINAAGRETKVGQALLLAKQLFAAKEMAIQLGVFKSKLALSMAGATAAAGEGAAKTAAVGFPQNIPLLIAFGAQIAGIIGTIKGASKMASGAKTKGFARGGFTDPFGLGYRDDSGEEVAGVVHTGEYVIPKFVRKDPEVPQIIQYLETKRQKKLQGYDTGGEVNDAPLINEGSIPSTGGSSGAADFMAAVQSLIARFDAGLEANVFFGPEAELKRQEQQKKLEKIRNRSKVKK